MNGKTQGALGFFESGVVKHVCPDTPDKQIISKSCVMMQIFIVWLLGPDWFSWSLVAPYQPAQGETVIHRFRFLDHEIKNALTESEKYQEPRNLVPEEGSENEEGFT